MGKKLEQAARVSAAEPTSIDAAEAALAAGDFKTALDAVRGLGGPRDRCLHVEISALLELGDISTAETRANELVELVKGNGGDSLELAGALVHLGRARYKASAFPDAAALCSEALEHCDRSDSPSDALRADVLGWRARCYRHMRLWAAAQTDLDLAMGLAREVGDERLTANLAFQASLLAERTGQTLMASVFAEQAKELYESLGDQRSLARILNNLGGLNWLLGRQALAFEHLREAFDLATEVGSDTDAAQAISSLAQVLLGDGQPEPAETAARHALDLLNGRDDYREESANASLVLGRALLEQERFDEALETLATAETGFTQVSATSAVAATLVVRGDVRRRQGELEEAADLYRRAADLLHDYRF
jgi:tetratricopeptide (TPR) repeat protein